MFYSRLSRFLSIVFTIALFAPFTALAIKLADPINAPNALEIYARIIKAFLATVGVFGLLNFAIAGVGLIASRGDPEKVKKSRDNMLWTIIGIAFLFGAYAVLAFVLDRLTGSLNIGTQ